MEANHCALKSQYDATDMQLLVDKFVNVLQEEYKDRAYNIDAFLVGYLSSFIAHAAMDNPDIVERIRDRMQMLRDN